MAKPIEYELPKRTVDVLPSAEAELRETLELLHQRGVLRMVNDALGSSPELLKILMGGLDNRSGGGGIQNIAAIVELIGHMPPEPFRRFCKGIEYAMTAAAEKAQTGDSSPRGITGTLGLLRDKELWHALLPLVHAAEAFAKALTQETNRAPHPSRFQPQ